MSVSAPTKNATASHTAAPRIEGATFGSIRFNSFQFNSTPTISGSAYFESIQAVFFQVSKGWGERTKVNASRQAFSSPLETFGPQGYDTR